MIREIISQAAALWPLEPAGYNGVRRRSSRLGSETQGIESIQAFPEDVLRCSPGTLDEDGLEDEEELLENGPEEELPEDDKLDELDEEDETEDWGDDEDEDDELDEDEDPDDEPDWDEDDFDDEEVTEDDLILEDDLMED